MQVSFGFDFNPGRERNGRRKISREGHAWAPSSGQSSADLVARKGAAVALLAASPALKPARLHGADAEATCWVDKFSARKTDGPGRSLAALRHARGLVVFGYDGTNF